jgi:quercetin dioxygenase-like cupin family protein
MKVVRGDDIGFVAASHEDPTNPGVLKRVLATATDLQLGQVMMVNWARLPEGSAFQSHFHEDMQEVFIMLSGPVVMTVDGDRTELVAGDAIVIDPQEVHKMENLSDRDVEYIVFGISSQAGGQTIVIDEPLA